MRHVGALWGNEMAERAGFEPARSLRPYAISSRARSSTPAPLRARTIPSIIGLALLYRKFAPARYSQRVLVFPCRGAQPCALAPVPAQFSPAQTRAHGCAPLRIRDKVDNSRPIPTHFENAPAAPGGLLIVPSPSVGGLGWGRLPAISPSPQPSPSREKEK